MERDPQAQRLVFLLDCDNTLLDNDALKADVDARLSALLGVAGAERFWGLYEAVRQDLGMVEMGETFTRWDRVDPATTPAVRATFLEYPFATRLFPQALATIAHLRTLGQPVILSDGDTTYQPVKIARSGLAAAVDGEVYVCDHKEQHLAEVLARWPADRYVMVDDKAPLLAAYKRALPDRLVSVHVRQGHYAAHPATPAPDLRLHQIGELASLGCAELLRPLAR